MTYREDFTLPAELLEQVQEQGLDVLHMCFGILGELNSFSIYLALWLSSSCKS